MRWLGEEPLTEYAGGLGASWPSCGSRHLMSWPKCTDTQISSGCDSFADPTCSQEESSRTAVVFLKSLPRGPKRIMAWSRTRPAASIYFAEGCGMSRHKESRPPKHCSDLGLLCLSLTATPRGPGYPTQTSSCQSLLTRMRFTVVSLHLWARSKPSWLPAFHPRSHPFILRYLP